MFAASSMIQCWAEAPRPGEPVGGLQVTLTTAQIAVHRFESLVTELVLENVSPGSLSVYRYIGTIMSTPGYVRYHLVNLSSGQEVVLLQGIDQHPPPSSDDYVRLAPGEKSSRTFVLDQVLLDWPRDSRLKPGRYALKLEVVISEEGRWAGVTDAWSGTVWTNPITFEFRP